MNAIAETLDRLEAEYVSRPHIITPRRPVAECECPDFCLLDHAN